MKSVTPALSVVTLWFERPPPVAPRGLDGICRIGAALADGESAGDFPVLRTLTAAPRSDETAEVWRIPPGRGADYGLVRAALAHGQGEVMVSVNGMGGRALTRLREIADGALILGYDAVGLDLFLFAEQLAWLGAQNERFAVTVDSDQQAVLAALAGASALVIPAHVSVDPSAVRRVAECRRPHAVRPLSAEEVDGVNGHEVSLTVVRPLAAGAVLTEADLEVAVVDHRGLSPVLAQRVVGLKLLYSIQPGEPLHFCHFEDPRR